MRRAFRRKAVIYSLCASLLVACLIVPAVRLVFGSWRGWQEAGEVNSHALSQIRCRAAAHVSLGRKECDITEIATDWEREPPDYLLTREDRYFVYVSGSYPSFWLNASDVEFLRGFREPRTFVAPTGEVWRGYAEHVQVDGKRLEVMVAEIVKSPYVFEGTYPIPELDRWLREETARIVGRLKARGARIEAERIRSKVDGWQIVEGDTGRVVRWGGWPPARFPGEEPSPRVHFHREGGELFIVRIDGNDNLVAVSLRRVADTREVVGVVFVFLLTFGVAYTFCTRSGLMRKYFLGRVTRRLSVREALAAGESRYVEFKREPGDTKSWLKDIAAFANTDGGTVFLGITDQGEVVGVNVPRPERDKFEQRLLNSIRDNIRPGPAVEVTWEEVEGRVVASVYVPAGEHLHSLEGRFYERRGVESVPLVDDEIKRLV